MGTAAPDRALPPMTAGSTDLIWTPGLDVGTDSGDWQFPHFDWLGALFGRKVRMVGGASGDSAAAMTKPAPAANHGVTSSPRIRRDGPARRLPAITPSGVRRTRP